MKRVKYYILALALSCRSLFAYQESVSADILTHLIDHFPLCGTLKKSGDFVYLDLNDYYIYNLLPFIEKDGFQAPPFFGKDLVGAHISVIYPEEVQSYLIKDVMETGTKIYFSPQKCEIVRPVHWKGIDEAFIVLVESADIQKIRKKYGLPDREYALHITIGVKPK